MRTPPTCSVHPSLAVLGAVWFSAGNQVAFEAMAIHTCRICFRGNGVLEASICITAKSLWLQASPGHREASLDPHGL